jgi:copper chaperone
MTPSPGASVLRLLPTDLRRGRLDLPPLPDETGGAAEGDAAMEFEVRGMTCGHCEAAIRRALAAVDPGAVVAIDRAAGRVRITRATAAPELLRRAIADEGYEIG